MGFKNAALLRICRIHIADVAFVRMSSRDSPSEQAYHQAVRDAELEYGLSALEPECTVHVQGFLLDPKYKKIIFVLPNADAMRLRGSKTLKTPALQLASVKLPSHYHGYETFFVSLWEYDHADLLTL